MPAARSQPPSLPSRDPPSTSQGRAPDLARIWAWLDAVPDPEIPVISLVDLGTIRDVAWQEDRLVVTVTPTYSGCPASAVIRLDIETALRAHGIGRVEIRTRIAPPWTTDWLTEKGRAQLEEYGIAPPSAAGGPARCPRCGSAELTRVSQFGSTPCKAQWRCQSCLEPFDYFKCI
ncbi:1,2-phenylacetyl-CoA epoxidase subunit PaaD [Phaeobacter sp. B1627]|uniref:1,2-phenylacetyl-CoA epoxidase subunit PaaD n=1 Tax=Phaeobacter sp. B1627 TaxID=2583809 RepID=UPI0011192A71|nr:1,2-phenylacetyl-CoA epoxidase subunit PaaD [Phaeobacter sp. B1627]TNJ47701.1 phenylacetate-CoA oxygenase subunit PaaJ [Phaeobacter sp. B1627]